jgi:hypothetical protein
MLNGAGSKGWEEVGRRDTVEGRVGEKREV